ncbi:MAG TPA: hypothetical protein VGH91_04980 [Gammaproteobacteria bacterium]|jgi:hypothetical protein
MRSLKTLTWPLSFASLLLVSTAAFADGPAIDLTQAKAVFATAQAVSNQEGGKLWGKTLYGALFFVDPDTRYVVSNEVDPDGVLHAQDGLYVGTLPKSVIIANAPVEWEGKRWTMLMWPYLPTDALTLRVTLGHEMFHRIQPSLGLMAPDSANLQLDTVDGRLWLQLEWRALAAALAAQGDAQTQAIRDALAFRAYRHKLFPGSDKTEASLEIAEGIPEYTGTIAGEPDRDSGRWRAIGRLTTPDQGVSFVRFFAYISGPPYGLLLDERMPGWRKQLNEKSDLSAMLASTLPAAPAVSVETRAPLYGEAAIRIAEVERAKKAEAVKARYRAALVDGPTLFLPGGKHFAFSFNPSAAVALDGTHMVYPTFHATAEWGTLDVKEGVLLPSDFSSATLAAPTSTGGTHIEGPGWTLDLAPGWHVVPGDKTGSYTVKKD